MEYTALLPDAAYYVAQYIADHVRPGLHYHNLEHITHAVAAAKQIADHYQLPEPEYATVVIAAWFHDLGYYAGERTGHEETGARLAAEYLATKNADAAFITAVSGCIRATKMPQQPANRLEAIVCDADLFHLGTADFDTFNKLMRKEEEAVFQKRISKEDWRSSTIRLLQQHRYHTDYCRLLLNDKKQENLGKLLAKQQEKAAEAQLPASDHSTEPATPGKKNPKDPGRGIETMFRITSTNNQRLSDMADNKAQILITVNSIILSAIITLLLRKLDAKDPLVYPTFLILSTAVITMVVGILATRPSLPNGIFTKEDVDSKKINLLFFGNFYRMHLDEYASGMRKIMGDKDFLYDTLIKDVFSQGVVLGRKYKLLRLAYNIFMFGIIFSVIGFLIAMILND
ncbi:Pycsar system effector family protein [Niabella drilacis]|uniref:Predicted metal-dependent phosphohydrolase, HD superfamily n=1 Tax=Niabella drilacis (strain DSM 25811 / CCM 8410 / CCUG 62505 / LMG 26954 / E90) TaxID=1285928 RepID=A0A1G6XAM4_NIADE|nr:Pycsar system effector family protein [Niabella drilacis]SDD75239.1 Predicted metal-dependent phosphohydrolase, HD superfamily [Niabella drilacis]